MRRQQEQTQTALDIVVRAYVQDERDHGIEPGDDSGEPNPSHPGLLLPEKPKPLKAHEREVIPEPVFMRMYQ